MLVEVAPLPPSLIPTLWNIGILHYKQAKLPKNLQHSVSWQVLLIELLYQSQCIVFHCASNTNMRHSSLLDFFHMTSLDGWNFFPYRNFKPFDCIIWSVAILTSMTFCGLFITQQIQGIIISIDDSKNVKLKKYEGYFFSL